MTESPDLPWAKRLDGRIKNKRVVKPSESARIYSEFLISKKMHHKKLLEIGCGNSEDSIYFSNLFELHLIDKKEEPIKDLDLHGIKTFCANIFEFWLFEDNYFDAIFDKYCFGTETDESKKEFYKAELFRCLVDGGFYFVVLNEYKKEDFDFLKLVKEEKINGKYNLIFRK